MALCDDGRGSIASDTVIINLTPLHRHGRNLLEITARANTEFGSGTKPEPTLGSSNNQGAAANLHSDAAPSHFGDGATHPRLRTSATAPAPAHHRNGGQAELEIFITGHLAKQMLWERRWRIHCSDLPQAFLGRMADTRP